MQNTGYFLYELALYYLIYAEGANLRHMAELLWFIFWICRNSKRFEDVRSYVSTHCSPHCKFTALVRLLVHDLFLLKYTDYTSGTTTVTHRRPTAGLSCPGTSCAFIPACVF